MSDAMITARPSSRRSLWIRPPARLHIPTARVRASTLSEILAAVGPLRKNADGKLLKLSTGALMKDCCCDGGVCTSCGFCDGCASEDLPGCPTADCCTPDRIQVVVTNVDAAICDCFPVYDIFGTLSFDKAKLVNPAAVDGTVTLTQDGFNSCLWTFTKTITSSKVDIYNAINCTGTRVGGSDPTTTLTYSLLRFSATVYRFQIFDGFGNTYFGANGAQCGDGVASSATATEMNCKDIPDQTNAITQCCLDENTLRSCLSTGGNATFTPCPIVFV